MYLSLSGEGWRLKGWLPYNYKFNMESGIPYELPYFMDWIPAEVPGSIHRDLIKSGTLEDPYYETNALNCEWVENKWWQYQKKFTVPAEQKGRRALLIFKGVDYKASFYFNGVKLGCHENMFTAVKFDVTELLNYDGENVLDISMENVPEDQPQIGFTSQSRHQKSRFGYSWDFSTRLNNMGLWQEVGIKFYDSCLLEDIHVICDVIDGKGVIRITGRIEASDLHENSYVKLMLSKDNKTIHDAVCSTHYLEGSSIFAQHIIVENPKLWYPNGMGEQELYTLKISSYYNEVLQDEKTMKIGIRKLQYAGNEGAPAGAIPYTVIINGEKVYIKGVNFVPLDQMYGAVLDKEYEYYIKAAKHANINLIRVWGGGIIEKEIFYKLCDENGMMVWQEFTQSNSGLDGIPSTREDFMKKLEATAVEALKEKRNHVSLTFWGGGNELKKDDNRTPVDLSNKNIKMLHDLVAKYDPQRLFYPSCPNGPLHGISIQEDDLRERKNHNIHGPWQYAGINDHYELFNKSNSLFHGEFGANGTSSAKTLRKILSDKNFKPSDAANFVWRFHNASWWDSYKRDVDIFGEKCTENMDIYTLCSQFIQAEGIRYSLEANRRRKYENSGSMIWQMNEPWPNVDCTSLIDYYKEAKMAYYWVKKAYELVHLSLKYWKLNFEKGENFEAEIFISNSGKALEGNYSMELLTKEGKVLYKHKGYASIQENRASSICKVNVEIAHDFPEVFFARVKFHTEQGTISENLYVFSTKSEEVFKPLLDINKGNIEISTGFSEGKLFAELLNSGEEVRLFVNISSREDETSILCSDNFITLFPGERKKIRIEELYSEKADLNKDTILIKWLNK